MRSGDGRRRGGRGRAPRARSPGGGPGNDRAGNVLPWARKLDYHYQVHISALTLLRSRKIINAEIFLQIEEDWMIDQY